MIRPARSLLPGLLLLGALLAGCSSDGADPEQVLPEPSEPVARSYVALGDSYTAAPLIPGKSSDDGCFRSDANYPALAAAALPGVRLVDRSCSGARTRDMAGPQATPFGRRIPPQLTALRPDTDLVTLGIGGNDFDVFGNLTGLCPRLRANDPAGSPCRATYGQSGVDTLLRDAGRTEARIAAVVRKIRKRSPEARIVLVDYPRIIPATGRCPKRLPLADGDYPWAARVNQRLSASVRGAAERTGVEHLDVYAASAGHDICADDPWVNGRRTEPGTALAYHPLAEEQQAVADLLVDLLETPAP